MMQMMTKEYILTRSNTESETWKIWYNLKLIIMIIILADKKICMHTYCVFPISY